MIYNEIIDTMRAIMNIFKFKKSQILKKKQKGQTAPHSPRRNPHKEFDITNENPAKSGSQLEHVSNKFDLLEEL